VQIIYSALRGPDSCRVSHFLPSLGVPLVLGEAGWPVALGIPDALNRGSHHLYRADEPGAGTPPGDGVSRMLSSYRELIVIKREERVPVAARQVGLFLSWSHQDLALKEDLVRRLTPSLSILRGPRIGWWEDSHLLLGDDFRSAIVGVLGGCDYGVLLLSPSYVASRFVARYELPRFVGPTADRGALPVALRPLPLDGSRELHGIEEKMIFMYRGKAFGELNRAGRDGFASELATQVRRRILRDRPGRL
jgi:hypothetical protein